MQTQNVTAASIDKLLYLPGFARYLINHKLNELAELQIRIAEELDPPVMKLLKNYSFEERVAIEKKNLTELLTNLSKNEARQHIENSVQKWKRNQLSVIGKDDVVAEDITLIIYLRRKSFLYFLPDYCRETEQMLELIKEIDLFLLESETSATNFHIKLLKDRIDDHSHFIEKITNTSPGIIYVYDVINNKEIYANKATTEFLGYKPEDLTAMGNKFVETLIHSADLDALKQHEKEFKTTKDGEVRSFKYRIKNYKGEFRWLRTYETVFKRNTLGEVIEKIGIAIDIHQQQLTADKLHKREAELLEAQEIAQLGSFNWDFEEKNFKCSPQTEKILGLGISNPQAFLDRVHPNDKKKVDEAIKTSLSTGKYECEFRYLSDAGIKTLWTRGVITYMDSKPLSMHGTVMDTTERQKLIDKLQENESLYKQAEALAHIGNYTWNQATNEIKWSDELYRIYGLEPQSETVDPEFIRNFNHPEDVELAQNEIQRCLENKQPFDFTYRIYTRDGHLKILHARGDIKLDDTGNPLFIIGTAEDVTEKQTLIKQLSHDAEVYKQAEELANMGNWSWDVKNNKLSWTDQLYKIYGLAPQSEEITIDRFLSFVHPEDRSHVESGIQEIYKEKNIDYTFRIITADGKLKILRSLAHADFDEKGNPVFVIGTERDITEKQNLIDSLKQSENLYKQAQSLARMGNFVWDIKTGDVTWSDEVYSIYGLPIDTVISFSSAFEPILSAYKPTVQEAIEQTIKTKKGRGISYAIQQKKGDVKYINLKTDVILDLSGNVSKIIGTAQDVTENQQLIEKLQKSEHLYKQAQSLAHMGNWTWEVETDRVEWSEELYKIYEVPYGEQMTYNKVASFIHPDDRESVLACLQESVKTGAIYDKHHRIILRNGKAKTIHRRAEIIKEKGSPVKMVGTTQDITEFYRVQQELKENQTFIRKITDATPSIIASYNINTGRYVFISEGLEKLLGYNIQDVMEQGVHFFLDIIHPDDAFETMQKNAAALEEANANPDKSDLVIEFTYRMRHKKGGYRWFHTYGTIFDRNNEGKVEHILNISLDVTEQKEATQKIAEQEHFIQQIADASPTILYLYDVDKQSIVYINREIFFVLGYLPDEIIEARETITGLLYHPEDYSLLPARKQSAKNFQQADSMMQYECRLKSKEEDWRWFLVREIVFKTDEKGHVKQILGAALDINRRKEMERTILQNTLQLEQSNASLEEFAYVASHDLKEPLRKISTFGDRLVASHLDKLSPEGRTYLTKIVDASQRMQTMISDLLSISMIAGNRSFEPYSLQKILDETIQTLEFKIEQQNAVIRYDTLPEAQIIPSQFRQLFQNLLSNSLKFVKENVQPVVTIKYSIASETETIHYQLAQAEQYHKIEFADNGIGFENEFANKIFAIFQRLHGRSEYEGSGIGLAICKKIVEHHGGIIYANGIPDAGATFTIILPASG